MADRIVSPKNRTEEVGLDVGLRPQSLDEYIGQDRVKENLRILIEAATGAGRGAGPRADLRPARPGQDDAGPRRGQRDGRRHQGHRRAGHRAGRRSGGHPDQPATRATCSSSTRSTAWAGSWKRYSTRPWRTLPWTLSSARGRGRAASASSCPASPSSAPRPAWR